MNDWCLSGGADGADLEWGLTAKHAGHRVIHFSFARHRTKAPPQEIELLNQMQLTAANPHCVRANATLQRQFPPNSDYVANLLRRDWYQIAGSEFTGRAESCYAVSSFGLPNGPTIPLDTVIEGHQVDGGTAWAVTMFIDHHNGDACPCYVFDQEVAHWFEWIGEGRWRRIYEPPKPHGVWAGIGKRKLNAIGRLAIRVLMDYRMSYHDLELVILDSTDTSHLDWIDSNEGDTSDL